jgi:hypothetical protein
MGTRIYLNAHCMAAGSSYTVNWKMPYLSVSGMPTDPKLHRGLQM